MGHVVPKELLIARWTELVNDPSLHDLPYKIELNPEGRIEMSPASNRHGMIQGRLAQLLGNALPDGQIVVEASILTDLGVRVPDVVWASPRFLDAQRDNTPFTVAPEICVEIASPSNSRRELDDKARAYLAAGALEVWIIGTECEVRIVGPEGERTASAFGLAIELALPGKRGTSD